jgi:DNA-binding HxlR family transcriptional regulator
VLGNDYRLQDCSLARTLEVIGERWTLLIVRDLFLGVRRFNDFQAHLDIPKAVLSDRLAKLAHERIVERRPDPDHAGRHVYELTAAGRDLWPALFALLMWGARHRAPTTRIYAHAACGTPLAPDGSCPECLLTPGAGDVVARPRRGRVSMRTDPVTLALRRPHRLLEPLRPA